MEFLDSKNWRPGFSESQYLANWYNLIFRQINKGSKNSLFLQLMFNYLRGFSGVIL